MFFKGCPTPPAGEKSTHKISFTHIDGEYWTDTKVTYTCDAGYTLDWDSYVYPTLERVCTSNGNWDDNEAPVCVPSLYLFVITRKFIDHT